ncbi:class II aldolase/adducin family protein [Baekduia soli]|uniref:Class II aldolase/adducin family protein n=1 Tax=Baekduia soli TaxID=496014 RepID=A0A5B8UBF6_9ACTN|nr:class II aldolase/adducin family protein [Baekduia soli]QEC50513.1 class II aldolase/adducin family protein [Baekduia soli]
MRAVLTTPRARAERQVLAAGRALAARDMVTGTTGNVSVRRGDRIVITPSRTAYATMRRRDLVTVGLDGAVVRGTRSPSRELALHLAIYAARPDARALVHTHTPHATAWSFLDLPLRPRTEEMDYYAIGEIRTSRPAPAGSAALARAAVDVLGDARAVLLGHHGAVTVGADLDEALAIAQAVEHQAHVAWLLRGGDRAAGPLRRSAHVAPAGRRP